MEAEKGDRTRSKREGKTTDGESKKTRGKNDAGGRRKAEGRERDERYRDRHT